MLNLFINLLKTPKTQLGILLTLIFITAFINNPSLKVLVVFLLSLVSTVLFDLLFLRLRKIKWFFPSGSLVTGSIIGLLTSPFAIWYIPVAIAAFAMFSKNFIRLGNRHVFNPAAFGLLVGAIIFGYNISWWAVSFQQFSPSSDGLEFIIYFLILLCPSLISMLKMKRYRITLSFLSIYILVNLMLNSKFLILNSILDPTILFFSIVMLPEPMTSPNNHKRQVIFGAFVGFIALILGALITIDPFLSTLLIANALFFMFR